MKRPYVNRSRANKDIQSYERLISFEMDEMEVLVYYITLLKQLHCSSRCFSTGVKDVTIMRL